MAKIYALDPIVEFDYILKSQRADDEADQIIWKLKPLSAREQSLLDDKMGSTVDGEFSVKIGSLTRLALDMGLMGVSNFFTSNGSEFEIKRSGKKIHGFVDPLLDSCIDRIPKDVRLELAEAIKDGSEMESQDKKN